MLGPTEYNNGDITIKMEQLVYLSYDQVTQAVAFTITQLLQHTPLNAKVSMLEYTP